MRVEDVQLGMQIPNVYNQGQPDRFERTESTGDDSGTFEGELIPPETGNTPQAASQAKRTVMTDRPVNAVQNDPMQGRNDPMENSPGLIIDIQG